MKLKELNRMNMNFSGVQTTDHYPEESKVLIAVDCVILGFSENEIKLLTHRRRIHPYAGELSLLGGFVRSGESLDETASRILKEITGLQNVYMEQVKAYSDINRDPVERVISIAYFALINIDAYPLPIVDDNQAAWLPLEEKENLIFDHTQMVDDAIFMLRQRAATQPIGFTLLPHKFTLTQLQSLYESIYSEKMDKRNFRKKVLAMNLLERLNEKDKINSKRGAFLFVFNEERYHKMLKKGFVFTV